MAKFDPNRTAPTLLSLEHATDPTGTVLGYYCRTSDPNVEVFMPVEFVREHWGPKQAERVPNPTKVATEPEKLASSKK